MKLWKKKKGKSWSPNGYLFAAARKICRWSPAYRECKRSVSCAKCGHVFEETETKLADHIDPVVDPTVGFVTWDIYYDRLFNGVMQALCKTCHDLKTKGENKIRRARKK